MSTTRTPVRPVDRSLTTRPARRQWPWFLALFLVIALVGGGAYVLYRTPVLGLQQLEVSAAAGDLSGDVSDAVRAAADIPEGTPLITVDLDSLRRRVLTVPQIATAEPTPDREAVTGEFSALITACMEKLAPSHREILTLRNVLNHPYGEIAKILGITVGTVKSRMARARCNLRILLARECPEFAPDAPPSEWFELNRPTGRFELASA